MKSKGTARNAKQIRNAVERLRCLSDGIDEVIYVSDPRNYEILFANRQTKEQFGNRIVGKKCFKVFRNLDKPCPLCTNKEIFGKKLGKTYVWDHQNAWNKHWYRGIAKAIKWPGRKYVRYGMAIDITKHKETENALKQSEEKLQLFAKNAVDLIYRYSIGKGFDYVNPASTRMVGYSPEEFYNDPQIESKIVHPEDRQKMERMLRDLCEHRQIEHVIEIRWLHKNGNVVTTEQVNVPIYDDEGKLVAIEGIVRDVTERRKMEEERKHFEERLSALNKYGQNLNMAKNLEEVCNVTLKAMEKTLGFEHASILRVQKKKLSLVCSRGYSKQFSLELPLNGGKGVTVRATKTGRSVFVPDLRNEEAYVLGRLGMLSELAVPIKTGRKVLGVLNVESRKRAAFKKEDQKLLEILASHAATAINNLMRKDQLKKLSDDLEHLMKSTVDIMHAKNTHQRLKVITKTIRKIGWRRVVISLRDENLEGIDVVTEGLTPAENKLLMERKAPGYVWKERIGPRFDPFKIGEFYYLPWNDPWIREYVHGVPPDAPPGNSIAYAGVPSRLSPEEMIDWHPQDMLYAPLRTPEGRVVGILSMDDPIDGQRPTRESLAPLGLFLPKAAIIIENAQLIENLREARRQLETYADKLEQKVEERTRELRASQEQLLRAQRLAVIGELAGMVGHDLRNPLTSISGATYYVKKRMALKSDDKTSEMLELIEKNIGYSNKIINDLLDYSREIKLDLTETALSKVIKEAFSLVTIPKNIQVKNLTQDKQKIKIDIGKLTRAFVNIIKNAVDAMPRGGKLTIECKKLGENLQILFSDTGLGMSKETLAKLWTPLFTTKAKGMGFGLPICKRVIEAHGGSISVASILKKGTTFAITLPIEPKIEEGGEEYWIRASESSLLTMTKT